MLKLVIYNLLGQQFQSSKSKYIDIVGQTLKKSNYIM